MCLYVLCVCVCVCVCVCLYVLCVCVCVYMQTDPCTIMMLLAIMDPEGTKLRKQHCLRRRTYTNKVDQ